MGKIRRFLQCVTGNRVELWAAQSWVSKLPFWSWTISNQESSLCTWHTLSPAHGRLLLVWSGNKLGSSLDHLSEVDKSQSGESPGDTLNSWCGLHLRMLTCRAEICYFLHQCSFWLCWSRAVLAPIVDGTHLGRLGRVSAIDRQLNVLFSFTYTFQSGERK